MICAECQHDHAGPELGGICVGCPCPLRPTDGTAVVTAVPVVLTRSQVDRLLALPEEQRAKAARYYARSQSEMTATVTKLTESILILLDDAEFWPDARAALRWAFCSYVRSQNIDPEDFIRQVRELFEAMPPDCEKRELRRPV